MSGPSSQQRNTGVSPPGALAEKNILSLRQIDSEAKSIIAVAKYTAVYNFVNQEWEKTNVDGPLFVYMRNTEPVFGLCIANRTASPDFVEFITCEHRIKFKPPYILIYFPAGSIKGLWFYESAECSTIYKILSKLTVPKKALGEEVKQEAVSSDEGSKGENDETTLCNNDSTASNDIPSESNLNNCLAQMLGDRLKFSQQYESTQTNSQSETSLKCKESPQTPNHIISPHQSEQNRLPRVNESPSSAPIIPGLTKEQFLIGITHLLHKDDSLLTSIHNAYIEALTNALKR
uniref:mRNA_decap_C domain-containing protein n=1 Tax=Rhabditophanes sp. KR3021 TaxID=114890 RepID=A0AC35TGA7_9BILA